VVEDARLFREGHTAVVGGLGGLFSHQMANLNASLEACSCPTQRHSPLFFLDEAEVCFVVRPGRTVLQCEDAVHCSLLPLFGAVREISTQGLAWNLDQSTLKFGELGK
jgi:thiamine pyrophosphokinase